MRTHTLHCSACNHSAPEDDAAEWIDFDRIDTAHCPKCGSSLVKIVTHFYDAPQRRPSELALFI